MKKFQLIVILISISADINYSQWFWQNPYPQGQDLYSATMVNTSTVLAVGEFGTIVKSTDSGESWTVRSQIIDGQFKSIFTVDQSIIYAVGYDYKDTLTIFFKSSDYGNSWENNIIATPNHPGKLHFIDAYSGFLITHLSVANFSSQILRTSDGGNSWSVSYNYSASSLYCISFFDNLNGLIAASNGNILKTTNGGNSWEVVITGNTNALLGVTYSDLQNCIAVGERGTILLSTDGGNSWQNKISNTNALLRDVKAFDNNYVAVGDSGTILTSSDGGQSWIKNLNTNKYELFNISCIGENGFIVGTEGSIIETSDNGVTWQSVSSNLNLFGISDIAFSDFHNGISLGSIQIAPYNFQGLILKTSDGGDSWNLTNIDFLPYSVCIITPDVMTIVGSQESIIRSTDGGNTWLTQLTGNTYEFIGVSFNDVNNGFVIGSRFPPNSGGTILKTTDGGANWESLYNGNIPTLYDLCYMDQNTVVVVGTGIILKTTNAGESWDTLNAGVKGFRSVYFTDGNNGVVLADSANSAIILRTTDGGTTWIQQTVEIEDVHLYEVNFSDYNNGTIVGEIYSDFLSENNIGIILKTSDGGVTWSNQNSGTKNHLTCIEFIDNQNGWVAGSKGTILHTINGGVTFVEEQIDPNQQQPNSLILIQNYPNPFNPGTKISWQVPVGSHQTLKIYDVLGNEIVTLVDDYKPAGTYEVEWDATGLPSGVYFYQLKTEGYVETKKMVLLR